MAKSLASRLADEIYRKLQINPTVIFDLSSVIVRISAKTSDNCQIIVPNQ